MRFLKTKKLRYRLLIKFTNNKYKYFLLSDVPIKPGFKSNVLRWTNILNIYIVLSYECDGHSLTVSDKPWILFDIKKAVCWVIIHSAYCCHASKAKQSGEAQMHRSSGTLDLVSFWVVSGCQDGEPVSVIYHSQPPCAVAHTVITNTASNSARITGEI